MANGSGNVSNIIGLGAVTNISGVGTGPQSFIPIANPTGGAGTYAVFSLWAGDANQGVGGAGYFAPFYKNGVAYQVTAGKTAYCFNISGTASAGGNSIQLVSATASISFGASSIAGGVYQSGAAGKYSLVFPTSGQAAQFPGIYTFGASTYAGIQVVVNTSAFTIHTYCFEN